MTHINDAHILITGATGGFGRELTRQLSGKGGKLLLADINSTALEELASEYENSVTGIAQADLSSREGCEALYQQAQATGRPIDILINNAGIAMYGRLDEVPADQWEMMMEINLLSPMRLTTMFMPEMIARKNGHIVNISSVAGWVGPPGLSAYAASKFGLRGFGESIHDELKRHNISVTTVYPFFSRTPILNAPSYGSMAEHRPPLPESQTTDPAMVMAAAVAGIESNRQHVFPDRFAKLIHRVKRYAPGLIRYFT